MIFTQTQTFFLQILTSRIQKQNNLFILAMQLSSHISKESDSYHMLSREQRMLTAKRIFQLLRKTPQKNLPKEQDKSKDPIQNKHHIFKEGEQISDGKQHLGNEVSLAILEGLQNGVKLCVISKEDPLLSRLSYSKLRNISHTALKKLSRTFVELLPKNIIDLSQQEFKNRYLFNGRMLAFYKRHDLSLIKTFRNLFQLKEWQRENKEYLNRGFLRDYAPDDIVEKLNEVSQAYRYMHSIYDSFQSQAQREKRKKTPRTQVSLPKVYPATGQSIKDKIPFQQLLEDHVGEIKRYKQEQE